MSTGIQAARDASRGKSRIGSILLVLEFLQVVRVDADTDDSARLTDRLAARRFITLQVSTTFGTDLQWQALSEGC